jgi:hypothetical protein
MASKNATQLRGAKRGAAILATCIVQTLTESDPTFQGRFLKRLFRAQSALRDNTDGNVIHEMELLSWTQTLLTGSDHVTGQTEAFLGGV